MLTKINYNFLFYGYDINMEIIIVAWRSAAIELVESVQKSSAGVTSSRMGDYPGLSEKFTLRIYVFSSIVL